MPRRHIPLDDIGLEDDLAGGPDLGPDERDADLLDGSWEADYYAGGQRSFDWQTIGLGIGLLVLIAIVVVPLLVILR